MSILLYVSINHWIGQTMAIATIDYERVAMKVVVPDQGFETFVAKVQKAKTRKGKEYFVSRITIPKDAIKNIDVESGEYIFFKAKKAEWFHMLEWENMKSTWNMLPSETKLQIICDGLVKNGQYLQEFGMNKTLDITGATNPGVSSSLFGTSLLGESK